MDEAIAEQVCAEQPPDGAELFARLWVPDDPRSPDGDGLGPRSNASSCAACHDRAGLGGAGAADRNVVVARRLVITGWAGDAFALGAGDTWRLREPLLEEVTVQRNPPALWGAAAIDAVDAADIVAASVLGDPTHPEIRGRVPRTDDGGVGRFGWDGRIATLAGFVEHACANELGLETAAVHQRGPAAPGPDLDDASLDALVAFARGLPRPVEREVPGAEDGRELFVAIGCAACHRTSLGGVDGLYSDLLLHDLGPGTADVGGWEGSRPSRWRTPPLWGVASSGPWLHDGRADTLEAAVRAHGGEASRVRSAWVDLPPADREAVLRFLDSLVAPGPQR